MVLENKEERNPQNNDRSLLKKHEQHKLKYKTLKLSMGSQKVVCVHQYLPGIVSEYIMERRPLLNLNTQSESPNLLLSFGF